MPANFIKTSFRSLWRARKHNLLNIFALAIGIACAALIFLWIEEEMSYDDYHLNKENIYSIRINKKFGNNLYTIGSTPRIMAASLKNDLPGIVNSCRYSDNVQRKLFTVGDKPIYAEGRFADPSLFTMFTLPFVHGNAATAFPQLYSIVITEKAAGKLFGVSANGYGSLIGKSVRIDNEKDYTISGILKDLPSNSTLQFEWVAPYEIDMLRHQENANWNSFGPFTYVELSAQSNVAAINQQLSGYLQHKSGKENSPAFLFPMTKWHLYNQFENGKQTGGGQIEQVRLLSIIAWIILLIACINFMNLATARSEKRGREVGVHKVLGSGRWRLITKFMTETSLLALIAGLLAVGIVMLALPAFNSLMQKELSINIFKPTHIGFIIGLILLCGMVAGSYPALYLSSFKPITVLKGKLKTANAAFIRKGLVVLQFTVSVVFIIATIVVYRQVGYVKQRNLGFDKNQLIEVDLQQNAGGKFEVIKQDLLNTGLIQSVALADHPIMRGGNNEDGFSWPGKEADNKIRISKRYVSPGYFSTAGLTVVRGQSFREGTNSETDIVITKSLADIVSKENAIGTFIQLPDYEDPSVIHNYRVIAVVNDYVYGDIYGSADPTIFFNISSGKGEMLYLRPSSAANLPNVITSMQEVIRKGNPGFPVEFKFVDDQFNLLFINEIQTSRIAGSFAILAVIISCMGLIGLAAFTAERRTKEIGIRKILGASVAGISLLLSKEFLQLAIVSFLFAFPVAWWLMKNWLSNYDYRTSLSIWIFAGTGLILLIIIFLTISYQSIKAALVNPVKSLRTE